MKSLFLAIAAILAMGIPGFSQRYFTRDGNVKFNATSPLEKIEAVNKSGTCVLDAATGKMEWKVLVKGFQFESALMQEHFNENYLESSQYPNATFSGAITNFSEINLAKDGNYIAKVKGKMTMHGVTKDVDVAGTLKVAGGAIDLSSTFSVTCPEYNIAIPSVVRDKIAKEIKIMVNATLKPMK